MQDYRITYTALLQEIHMEGQTLHSNTRNRFECLTQQRSTIDPIDITLENDDRGIVKEMVRTPSMVSSALISAHDAHLHIQDRRSTSTPPQTLTALHCFHAS